jgi:hypothetical protein
MLVNFSQLPSRLAHALLNSAAPGPSGPLRSGTAELHGYACAHWWRSFAPHRVSFLSSSRLYEEAERVRKVRVFKNQCALPQERMRAERKGEKSW